MAKDAIFVSLIVVIFLTLVLSFGLNLTGDITGYIFADEDSRMQDFAKCLADNGAVMYASKACSACSSQQLMFGRSFAHIETVDCVEEPGICAARGIRKVPTWIIGSIKYEGTLSLERLSEITGCALDA